MVPFWTFRTRTAATMLDRYIGDGTGGTGMTNAGLAGHQVIVFLQENKTTDFYFPTLAAWGAAVANSGALLSAPPNFDQPHDRSAWVHWAMGDYPALAVQIDNDTVIPFYSYLAKQFVFADHHFGLGSNSTSGHMLAVGGQTPTMKNPPFVGPAPVWDLPSIFTVAETAGVSWAAFPDSSGYPTKFYSNLTTAPGASNVHRPAEFIPMAKAGTLPQICYVWSPAGFDEHPPATSNPDLRHGRAEPGLATGAGRHRRRRLARHHVHPDLGRLGRLRRLHSQPRRSRPFRTRCTRAGSKPSAGPASRCSCSAAKSPRPSTPSGTPTPASPKPSSTCSGYQR